VFYFVRATKPCTQQFTTTETDGRCIHSGDTSLGLFLGFSTCG